jgi:outer membrane protein assembly factor BamB
MMTHLEKLSIFIAITLAISVTASADNWTRFRGPNGSGVSTSTTVPLEWNANKNMKWTIDLPGPGSSCPIVFDGKVYLTCYTGYGLTAKSPGDPADLKRHLLCFDRNNGQELWRSTVDSDHDEDPYKGFIVEHGYASSTPVTDGEHLYVLFGKTGLVAFDMQGTQVWKTNLGTKSDPAKWGNGASCMLYKDVVIVNAGNVGHALVALNKKDGSEAWKITDPELTNSWSTPSVVTLDGHDELVINTPGKILGIDPNNGAELWRAKSPISETVCGSLAEKDGIVFAMGGRAGDAIAIKCGGQGDVSATNTVWKTSLRSGIGTPIVAGNNLYWTSSGLAYCASCETGKYVYKARVKAEQKGRRMPAGDYASPVSVGNHIFMTVRSGVTIVVKADDSFQQVAVNPIEGDDSLFNATPAISNGEIFIRSNKRLYCIANTNAD